MSPRITARAELPGASLDQLGVPGAGVLIAVSGGVDSTVLAHALVACKPKDRDPSLISLGHVNHGLRGAESAADEQAVREFGAQLELRVEVEHLSLDRDPAAPSSRARPTLQELARRERYAALERMADRTGACHIATAHTLDDQAETVLMRMLRGSGPSGLAGIPATSREGRVVRPFLRVSRKDVLEYAKRNGICWREDSSNASSRYTRSRIRHEWLPALSRAFNPKLSRALANLAEAQGRDERWLESLVGEEISRRVMHCNEGVEIDCHDFRGLPDALRWRFARHLVVTTGGGRELTEQHLRRILAALDDAGSAREIELPEGLRLATQGGRGRLVRRRAVQQVRASGESERPC